MRIDLDGDCSVASAQAIKKLFLDALASGKPTQVGFLGVTRVDLSFFELLRAARSGFAAHGVALTFCADLPEGLSRAAACAEFSELCQGGPQAASGMPEREAS